MREISDANYSRLFRAVARLGFPAGKVPALKLALCAPNILAPERPASGRRALSPAIASPAGAKPLSDYIGVAAAERLARGVLPASGADAWRRWPVDKWVLMDNAQLETCAASGLFPDPPALHNSAVLFFTSPRRP